MGSVLLNVLIQLFYFLGSVYLVGFFISKISAAFYNLFKSKVVCYVLGVIGTPVHELSHAFMCILFGHKVTEMKLFQIDDEDDKLGYVKHSYNPKNIYHQIGNYFIGVAPILIGTLVICLFMRLMVPNAYFEVSDHINNMVSSSKSGFSFSMFVYGFGIIKALFTNITSFFWWLVFMFMLLCISMHMSLSVADIKNSVRAIPFIALILLVVNGLVRIISKNAYLGFTAFMHTMGSYLISFLMLSLIFSIIVLVIAFLIRFIVVSIKLRK